MERGTLICDQCEAEITNELEDVKDEAIERGWVFVDHMDEISEEIVHRCFCDRFCMVNFFS